MKEQTVEQLVRPTEVTAKSLLMSIFRLILKLAAVQIVVNLLSAIPDMTGSIWLLFYVYVVVMILAFMNRMVASVRYVLTQDNLILTRNMGQSELKRLVIPVNDIVTIRPHIAAEDLTVTYRRVQYFGKNAMAPLRVRLAFAVSKVSGRLARRIAGKAAKVSCGMVIVYRKGEKLYACGFEPDPELLSALASRLDDRYLMDDRLGRPKLKTLSARCCARTFPEWYPHVQPLITPEHVKEAEAIRETIREERAKRKKSRKKAEVQRKDSKKPSSQKSSRMESSRQEPKRNKKKRRSTDPDLYEPDIVENMMQAEAVDRRSMIIPEHPEEMAAEAQKAALQPETEYWEETVAAVTREGRRRRGGSREEPEGSE